MIAKVTIPSTRSVDYPFGGISREIFQGLRDRASADIRSGEYIADLALSLAAWTAYVRPYLAFPMRPYLVRAA